MNKLGDARRLVRPILGRARRSPGSAPGMQAALHVSNGDATDLAGTGLARRILYWRDSLHEGPVPAVGSGELRRIRAASSRRRVPTTAAKA